jgi:hypothetical protein
MTTPQHPEDDPVAELYDDDEDDIWSDSPCSWPIEENS